MSELSLPLRISRVRSGLDWVTPALVALFMLSGASGLIYQISWVRLLSLTFGVTIYAVSVVVAAFMGGLAIGSLVGGRWADRVRRPIVWYALAELVIALMGLFSPTALSWVQTAYVALHPRDAAEGAIGLVTLRFALAALVLLIPTTLMGATLPLMVKGSLALSHTIGPRISWLYASNTAGAIVGTVAAGFVLIGALGITGAIAVAAALNLAAGVGALLVGRIVSTRKTESARLSRQVDVTESRVARASLGDAPPSDVVRRLVILTFAVQGFASLAYEVIWTRMFAVLLDGSTYAFSIVLATVLLGIALGSALISPLMSFRLPWIQVYALLQAGVAALAFVGIVAFARIYTITERLGELPGLAPLMAKDFGWMAVAVIACVLPVMVLLGASFPVAARIVVNPDRAGRDLGVLYASNTIGAILGAWTAGFWLLPGLGSQLTIELLATVNTVLAVGLALATGHRRVATGALALALTIASAGVMFRYAPDMYQSMLVGRFPETELVWAAEGIETSVTVVRTPDNGNHYLFLNGQHQASEDSGTVGFHELLAHLPMTIHPAPQDVLIIGLGGGVTAGTIARYGPQRLDVVELSETVVEGARFFGRVNGNVLNYPNLRLKIDDGRNHLLLTDRKYDVVTADVSHPRNAGAGILYSRDYYALARRALKPGGIMAQWLEDRPDRETNEDQRRLMARTFLAEFPHVSMWIQGSLLIGSNEPIDTSVAAIARHWSARGIEPILVPTGLTTPEAVRTMHVLSDAELRAWAGDGLIMSDNNPYVEYFLSLPRESGR